MDNSIILDKLIRFIEIGSASYGSLLLSNYLENKKKEKLKPSLGDKDFYDEIQPILEHIKEELKADSVCLWEGSNGETTLSGFHKKKLSIVLETVSNEKHSAIDDIENIPVVTFKRHLAELKNSRTSYIVSYEFDKHDELADLYQKYNLKTLAVFKINTGKSIKKWTGLLTIGFSNSPKLLTDADLAWLNTQSSRIGSKLTH